MSTTNSAFLATLVYSSASFDLTDRSSFVIRPLFASILGMNLNWLIVSRLNTLPISFQFSWGLSLSDAPCRLKCQIVSDLPSNAYSKSHYVAVYIVAVSASTAPQTLLSSTVAPYFIIILSLNASMASSSDPVRWIGSRKVALEILSPLTSPSVWRLCYAPTAS